MKLKNTILILICFLLTSCSSFFRAINITPSKKITEIKQKALDFLFQLKKEKNSIINNWELSGIEVKDAFTTQALIELKNEYCSYKRCLSCQIGNTLIKSQ